MGSEKVEFTPVATVDLEKPTLTEAETFQVKRSSRGVLFLCFIQLIMAFADLLFGGIIMMVISSLFISFGIVGVAKQRPRLLVAHFVYSLALYILSLVSFVLLVLYCESGCQWWLYAIGFFQVLFQAIGMRHERMLICLLKKKEGSVCSILAGRKCMQQKEANLESNLECTKETPCPTPQINSIPMIPYNQQMIPMEVQPRLPQYFPLQPLQYPMQPIVPLYGYPTNQQGVGLYPVMYKQI